MIDQMSEEAHMPLVEHVEDEDDCFEAIDKLVAQGINAGDINKLQDAGIYTCNGLMMQTKKSLTGIKGLSEAKVDKICEAAEKIINFGYITGSDVLLRRRSVVKITTGSQALDELLGGGIETSSITEAFGEFRSGKAQLAHTLCVSTQLPLSMHGGNGKVACVDAEGTFGPDRIVPIAERFGLDSGAVLDNIIYARAYNYEHQYNLLLGLAAKMSEEPFRLLIIDFIIALFRVDFSGRGELAERQQRLAQMLSRIIKIAEEFNVAVYMTNQVIPLGVNAGEIKKLQDAGMYSDGLMTQTKKRRSVVEIATGSQALDELLGGGIETSSIAEAFGELRSGEAQLAHTLCVSTQLTLSMHGGNGKVACVDTEGTFRPDPIVLIAERFGLDSGAVLDNIIDSIIALFRLSISGRGELPERQLSQLSDRKEIQFKTSRSFIGESSSTKFARPSQPQRNTLQRHYPFAAVKMKDRQFKLPDNAPIFLEHTIDGIVAFCNLESKQWSSAIFPLPNFPHNLLASNPSLLYAIGDRLEIWDFFSEKWIRIDSIVPSDNYLVVNKVKDLVVTARATSPTMVYNLTHNEINSQICPMMPRIYERSRFGGGWNCGIHSLSIDNHLFVMGNRMNTVAVFDHRDRSWKGFVEYGGGGGGWDFWLAGVFQGKLILVGTDVIGWRSAYQGIRISVWQSDLNAMGLPTGECQHICDMPEELLVHFRRDNHPEDVIRLANEYLCLYSKPNLVYLELVGRSWHHTINAESGNFDNLRCCVTVLGRRQTSSR